MKKVVVILLAVLLIVVVVASGYEILSPHIEDVDIWVSRSFPHQYFLRVVADGNTCWKPWEYCVKRFGNIVFLRVLLLTDRSNPCSTFGYIPDEEKIIPLGGSLVPNMVFMVVANDVVKVLVAEPRYLIKR